mgnify:CR=1 FL=1
MAEELEFLMSDGLLIRGTIEGNRTSNHLVVMLHSGGYDRHERGVKEVSKDEISGMKKIEYYNAYGNYDYKMLAFYELTNAIMVKVARILMFLK